MPCRTVRLPDGGVALVKMARVQPKICQSCGWRTARLQCDYPDPGRKSGTCDKYLCHDCAQTVRASDGTQVDFCPDHPPLEGEIA